MFPKAKSIIERIAHTECIQILKKGAKEEYTYSNLFKSPKEHTYHGLGKKFEEHLKKLTSQGKEFTLLRFISFFKKENFFIHIFAYICSILDYIVPLLMERYLRWIQEEEMRLRQGCLILGGVVSLYIIRLVCILQNMYYAELIQVYCKNTMEVNVFVLIFL